MWKDIMTYIMIITIDVKNECINKDINTIYKNVEIYNDIDNNNNHFRYIQNEKQ
jgi:hypothetical protein